jgi:putative SOS response-associated peptidase YedK
MCNRYRTDKTNEALAEALAEWREAEWDDQPGRNTPEPYEMFPNTPGRIVTLENGRLKIGEALWGMPTPEEHLVTPRGKKMAHDPGITNVRNTFAPHWEQWLGVENRCLVPFTRFCEPDQVGRTFKDKWFVFSDGRELAFFAGVRDNLSRQIKAKDPEPTTGEFYAFLTTKANREVAQYHSKAMPVILTNWGECERWLTGHWFDVKDLQRPLQDGTLKLDES